MKKMKKIRKVRTIAEHKPETLKYWDFNKNTIDPYVVSCFSKEKAWWLCENRHSRQSAIINVVNRGDGCSECNKNYLLETHPHLFEEWDFDKNLIGPEDRSTNSHSKVFWICKVCKLGFEQAISHKTRPGRGSGCPYCSKQKTTEISCLSATHPHLIKEWDFEKNTILVKDISFGSERKVWWKCLAGKEHPSYLMMPLHKVNKTKEHSGCPKCSRRVSVLENIWLDKLQIPNDDDHRQCTIHTADNKYYVDGYDCVNTVYEFNGDYFHGNPGIYSSEMLNEFTKFTFGELYSRTLKKQQDLEGVGFKVVSIWESEFLETLNIKQMQDKILSKKLLVKQRCFIRHKKVYKNR